MKKRWFLALLLLALAPRAPAQQPAQANLTAQAASCPTTGPGATTSSLIVRVQNNQGGYGINLAGTWSGTVSFFGSANGQSGWSALQVNPISGATGVTTATANGNWQVNSAGLQGVCVVVTTYSSGTVAASIIASNASARTNGGSGGSGAVSSVFGRTGAVVAANEDYTFGELGPGTNTNAGTFAFGAGVTFSVAAATGFALPTSAGLTTSSTLNEGLDSTNDNLHFWNGAVDVIGLGISSTPTNNDVAGFSVSGNQVLAQDLGAVAGGGANFLKCTSAGLTPGDYFGVNGSNQCAELLPGLTPTNISASGTTLLLSTYRGQLVKASSTSGSQTFALPDGTTTGFTGNFYFLLENHGTVGALSVTNNGGSYTFNGSASPFSLPEGTWCNVSNNSTSTGWTLDCSSGLLTAGTGIGLTPTQFGTTVSVNAVPLSSLASEAANTLIGALTATTPSALAVPSCSGATNALTWTSGTGFGCNTISSGTSTVGTADQTAQGADISATTLYTPASSGLYTVSCYVVLTRAASTSSLLPNCAELWTDADTSVSQANISTSAPSGNTVGVVANSAASGGITPAPAIIYAKGGTAIQYRTQGYTSVGATSMQFAIHVRVNGPF